MDVALVALVGVPLAIMALWLLFSIALPNPAPPPPSPVPSPFITVERERLIAAMDLEMQAAELRLRSGGMAAAAEGANLVRSRAIEFLKGFKP
jgi:hypothetical protein